MSNINLSRYSLGARWIHTMTEPPLVNRYVNVVDGLIESFTVKPTEPEIFNFGDECQILPGTVNAHAHLELSRVPDRLNVEPIDGRRPMADWVAELMRFRRGPVYDAKTAIQSAMLREEVLMETSAVADIVPPKLDADFYRPGLPLWLAFRELIAWTSKEAETSLSDLFERSESDVSASFYGVSPHAPQTICPALLETVINMDVPVAMHLAETPEEIEFLTTGTGPLFELMRQADPDYDPKKVRLGKRPMDYLRCLSRAPETLIVHGNYLDDKELKFLAEHRETMAVVYCPRSHDYFAASDRSEKYPLKKMLDLGVQVLLGTDSLASTPDLSIVGEMKHVLRHHPEIPAETVFRMGTAEGGAFFELESGLGTLRKGAPARFAFF